MDVRLSGSVEDAEWDDYLSGNPCGDHEQTTGYAAIRGKQGFKSMRLLAKERTTIVGGVQILYRPTPLGVHGLVCQGPITESGRGDVAEALVEAIDREVSERGITRCTYRMCDFQTRFSPLFRARGFRPNALIRHHTPFTAMDSDPDDLLASLKRSTRRNIRTAEKKGVTVTLGQRKDIETFYHLHKQTSGYQQFPIFPKKYFYYLWDLFAEKGRLLLLVARYQGDPIAAMVVSLKEDRVMCGWGGTDRNSSSFNANYLILWNVIKEARARGATGLDMGGIDAGVTQGVSYFKKSFAQEVHAYPDSLEKFYGIGSSLKRKLAQLRWLHQRVEGWQIRKYGRMPH